MRVTSVDKKIDIRLPISTYIRRAKYKNYYIAVTRFENQRLENHVEIHDKDRKRLTERCFAVPSIVYLSGSIYRWKSVVNVLS